ncbi:MAG: hypothetical protein DRI61_03465 [Chloroflexi bacterium]|nr:MAG: hypothetical protein DRI61_03465 [Chloroflexota bacterium]
MIELTELITELDVLPAKIRVDGYLYKHLKSLTEYLQHEYYDYVEQDKPENHIWHDISELEMLLCEIEHHIKSGKGVN